MDISAPNYYLNIYLLKSNQSDDEKIEIVEGRVFFFICIQRK
jgi:hypothetical protein